MAKNDQVERKLSELLDKQTEGTEAALHKMQLACLGMCRSFLQVETVVSPALREEMKRHCQEKIDLCIEAAHLTGQLNKVAAPQVYGEQSN